MLSGILNINKPKGLTSHDVVSRLRKILNMKKIGHTGTLDPAATGVLPICLGKTTRLIQYFPSDKQYIAEITLGITTDSYDSDGNITSKQKVILDKENITKALEQFKGEIIQTVPVFSATHYKGKKLYEYAHKGIEVTDLPTKTVTIYDLELIEIINESEENPIIVLKIDCSTGTYIRSIAYELGKALGYGAYLSKLTRTIASKLKIEDSITLEDLEKVKEDGTVDRLFSSPANIIDMPSLKVGFGQIERISKGQFFKAKKPLHDQDKAILLIDKENNPIAVCMYSANNDIIKPITVLI